MKIVFIDASRLFWLIIFVFYCCLIILVVSFFFFLISNSNFTSFWFSETSISIIEPIFRVYGDLPIYITMPESTNFYEANLSELHLPRFDVPLNVESSIQEESFNSYTNVVLLTSFVVCLVVVCISFPIFYSPVLS